MESAVLPILLDAFRYSSPLEFLVIFFIFIYYKNSKKFDKKISNLFTSSAGLFQRKIKSFTETLDLNSFILSKLQNLMFNIGADRVMIVQYHNGEHSLNGADFAKMTCTHEVVNKKTRPKNLAVQTRLLGVPVTAFSYVTRRILKDKVVVLFDIEKLKTEHPSTCEEFKAHGANSAVIVRLSDLDDNIAGYMVAEYCCSKLINSSRVANNMVEVSGKISTLLEGSGILSNNTKETKTDVKKTTHRFTNPS